jgi:hypothetical protein
MKKMTFLISISFSIILIGCATGKFTYIPSSQTAFVKNSIDVEKSRDSTWEQLIAGLSSGHFVINTMDKQSGFINLSYTGDPEKYVEGGELSYTITNLRGERNYRFPASRAHTQYETTLKRNLYSFQRQLNLEASIDVLLFELSPTRTRLTVNTIYILSLKKTGYTSAGQPVITYQETIAFNSGLSTTSKAGVEYRSNGKFEQSILKIFK